MADNKKKTSSQDRQLAFASEYVRDYNATAAAIRAGYAPRSANAMSTNLLKKTAVRAEIDRLEAERSLRYGMTEERLIHEISKRALVNVSDIIDENGNLRPGAKRDDMSTITRIKTRTLPDGSVEHDITVSDSAKYLDLLCKVLGHVAQKENKAVKIDADGNVKAGVIYIPAVTEIPSESVSEARNDEK